MSWLDKLKDRLGNRQKPENGLLDLIEVSGDDPYFAEHEAIREMLREWMIGRKEELASNFHSPKLDSFVSFGPLNAADRETQARYVACLVSWLLALDLQASAFTKKSSDLYNPHIQAGWADIWGPRRLLAEVFNKLMQRKLPVPLETVQAMLRWWDEIQGVNFAAVSHFPFSALISTIEGHAGSEKLTDSMKVPLEKLGVFLRSNAADSQMRRFADRIDVLLDRSPELPLVAGEVWANAAIEDLTSLSANERTSWAALLQYCKDASGGTPTVKWLKQAEIHLGQLDHEQACRFLSTWFSLTDKKRAQSALSIRQWVVRCAEEAFGKRRYEFLLLLPGEKRSWKELEVFDQAIRNADDPWDYLRNFQNQPEARKLFGEAAPAFQLPASPPVFAPVEDLLIIPPHMDLLVGLAWLAGLLKDPAVTRSVGAMAVSMYRKVPGKGPRAVRTGNACITALGMIGDADALGQLALLKVKVKFGGAQIAIDKAMAKLAAKLEVPCEELEEMSVPAYGMTEVGRLIQPIGEFTAELTIINSRHTELAWMRADGKSQKSLPAAVKQEFAEDVKELMAAKKDIEKMLPAQAERLDGLYLRRKSWPLSVWRERYLDHPLVGALARRLLWNFAWNGTTAAGVWLKDCLVDRLGNPLALDGQNTVVTLWHPLHQESNIVLGWRGFLEEWEIVQPFKQAHREIYLLTPAEERTLVYSNRFAAHLLRQHQFNALCAARGWKNKLRLMVDAEYPPATRHLPQWGIRAEYWIEGAGTEYGEDTLESGAYRHVATDQIRFYQEDASQLTSHARRGGYSPGWRNRTPSDPLPLAQVDPLVFSEVMRDADLFVGVGSVGNDPTWLDGGRNEQQRDYWGSYSFGDLNASAQTRKVILERLVPKLKIAGACSFEEKFLIVQGKRHGYKIHLGSGNILIMPQDKYLCIVPAQGQVDKAGDKIFLPFEGDRTLSLILSKAFLLAADDKITDSTILRQLG